MINKTVIKKMVDCYKRQLVKYYKDLGIPIDIYKADMDYRYVNTLYEKEKNDVIDEEDMLFLIRSEFTRKCKDKKIVKKLTLLLASADEELQELGKEILKNYYK